MKMFDWIRQVIEPPKFDDLEKTHVAGLLNAILLTTLGLVLVYFIVSIIFIDVSPLIFLILGFLLLLMVVLYSLLQRGYVRLSSLIFLTTLWGVITFSVFLSGGVRSRAYSTYVFVILASGLLISWNAALVIVISSILVGLIALVVETSSVLPAVLIPQIPMLTWGVNSLLFISVAGIIYLAVTRLKDALGNVQAEVEARNQTEAALRISEARYRTVIEESPYSIIIYSPDGRPIEANRASHEFWNVGSEGWEYLKETYNIFEDPHLNTEGIKPYLERAFSGEATRIPSIYYDAQNTPGSEFVTSSQERHWIQGYIYPIKYDSGQVHEVVVIHENITPQKLAQQALEESEVRFRELAENIREVFWLFDWMEQRVLYISPAFESVWGRSTQDLYARYEVWVESVHPDDREYAQDTFLQIAETGGGEDREYRIIRPGGEVRWISDRGVAIKNDEGEVIRIAGIAEDITARKESEMGLRYYAERLELLRDIDHAILTVQSPETVAQGVVQHLPSLIPCDHASVLLFDYKSQLAYILASYASTETPIAGIPSLDLALFGALDQLRAGQILFVDDLRADPNPSGLTRQLATTGLRSYIGIPIIAQGELIGALNLGSEETGVYNKQHISTARDISDQLAVALQNAGLYIAEREQRKLAEALRDMAVVLNQASTQDETLDVTLTHISRVLDHEAIAIQLADKGVAEVVRARSSIDESVARWRGTVQMPIATTPNLSQMAETGEPMVIQDTQTETGWLPLPESDWIRSWVGAPIFIEDQVVGFINLYGSNPGQFSVVDAQRLRGFVEQAAVALQKVSLLEAESERRKRAEILRDLTTDLIADLDFDRVLENILVHLRRLVPCDRAAVILTEGEGMRVVAGSGFPLDTHITHKVFTAEDGLLSELKQNKQPIIIADAQQDPRFQDWEELGYIHGWMGIPLVLGREFIGYLTLGSKQINAYTETQALFAQAFANQAAVVIRNARLFDQVRTGRERLQTLSSRLVEIQEIERRNIASELHDQIGQLLTGLKLVLDMKTRSPADTSAGYLEEAQKLVNELMTRVRELSLDLRPAMLDDLGLLPALIWFFEKYQNQTQIVVTFKHNGLEGNRFPQQVETATFRIVQEALTNVVRHAEVKSAQVRVLANPQLIHLQIEDHGLGFDSEKILSIAASSGLSGMRERAVLLGGRLSVESQAGKGTLVTADIPIHGHVERREKVR